MKILIIGTGKCGSGTLMFALSEDLNLDVIVEPFNEDLDNGYDGELQDDVIVKCINSSSIDDVETRNNFFKEYSLQFDKVILIDRRNEPERLFSVLHAHQYDTWTHKENYEPKDVVLNQRWMPYLQGVFDGKESITKLSKDMEIPIIYMEDLCTTDYQLSKHTYKNIIDSGNDFKPIYDSHFDVRHKQQLKIPK